MSKRPTYAELQRRVMELEAQHPAASRAALRDLPKAGDSLHASAAVLTITALGGRVIVGPVAIRDGLSAQAIDALRADVNASLQKTLGLTP